jgi:hypothetical protein
MRITATLGTDGPLRYRLTLEDDDRTEAGQVFGDPTRPLRLENRSWEVHVPTGPGRLHPDLHALALWKVVWPFVGRTLELPFAISAQLAETIERVRGLRVGPVDPALAPREAPERSRPALLFSGGVDSLAAALVMPPRTAILTLDRIPHYPDGLDPAQTLVDLVHTRALCGRLAADGRAVLAVREDHETLFRPYPAWHSEFWLLPALYLADDLDLAVVGTGDVLDVLLLGGYHWGRAQRWAVDRQRAEELARSGPRTPAETLERLRRDGPTSDRPAGAEAAAAELAAVGLRFTSPVYGLSEIGTALVVFRSPYRGSASSCYFPSATNYCLRCDKCFKKLLLDYVFAEREVPVELFQRFLDVPQLSRLFDGPYFDWHHVWYYLFQRIRCEHPVAAALREQAAAGPDLSVLERWNPTLAAELPPDWRAEVVDGILRFVSPMDAADLEYFAGLEVPPLFAPPPARPRGAGGGGGGGGDAGGEPDHAARLQSELAQVLERAHGARLTGAWRATVRAIGEADAARALALTLTAAERRLRATLHEAPPCPARRAPAFELVCADAARLVADPPALSLVRLLASWLDGQHAQIDDLFAGGAAERVAGGTLLLGALERLAAEDEPPLGDGFRAVWPVRDPEGGVRVTLRRGEERLTLLVHPRGRIPRPFLAGRRAVLTHPPTTSVAGDDRLAAARRLLERVDAALELVVGQPSRPAR